VFTNEQSFLELDRDTKHSVVGAVTYYIFDQAMGLKGGITYQRMNNELYHWIVTGFESYKDTDLKHQNEWDTHFVTQACLKYFNDEFSLYEGYKIVKKASHN
jgi:hypothetical protein